MERVEETNIGSDPQIKQLRSRLEDAPIRVAILFGSRATGQTHALSDIDIAVEFDGLEPGDPEYNERFFTLSADLSEIMGTDDIDLVDIRSLSPSFARSVFEKGILLKGTEEQISELRTRLLDGSSDMHSPQERFDDALRRIDEHLA
jgi:predicted nucleotidyltransferase